MKDLNEEDFRQFSNLARRLKRSDYSGESRVRDTLRTSLLDRPSRRRRGFPMFAWLVPAAVAVAVVVVFNLRHNKAETPVYTSASYSLPDDGYGQSGRQGLGDYQAAERF
jgi:ferric-dicitrate binding protein FerR (iron transport regulator)